MRAHAVAAAAATLLGAGAARADRDDKTDDADQLVVVNAAPKLGEVGQIKRLRSVLSTRGLLFKLNDQLEAALDGSNILIDDLDAIKDAFANGELDKATGLIDADEQHILDQAVNGDPLPALAELSQWRGIIAAARKNDDEAVRQFRAAYRMNPAWVIDKRQASPRVRTLVKKAHHEPNETDMLRVDADPDDAVLSIDGGDRRPTHDKIELPVGVHLVTISASSRAPYAELVDIQAKQQYRIQIALDKESKLDRATKLVDEIAAAPAGQPRLKRAKAVARLTGVPRMLVVEDGSESGITVRLYDSELRKVSPQIELDGDASSAAIARKIKTALDPQNLVDASTIVISAHVRTETPWYGHWYVWAGLAAVAIGGYGGYEYMTRTPTSVRGF